MPRDPRRPTPARRTPAAPAPPVRPARVRLRDGREVTIRAVRPEDAPHVIDAFNRLSKASRYLRFMAHKKAIDPAMLAHGVQAWPGRELALVATVPSGGGDYDIVGGARYAPAGTEPTTRRRPSACEFAITVDEAWRGSGLATTLLRRLIGRARRDGYRRIEGRILAENAPMLGLARSLGFAVAHAPDDPGVMVAWKTWVPRPAHRRH